MFSRVVGVGHALPSTCISNTELSQYIDTSDEWIVERTGIHQRYRISGTENTSSLATQAALAALQHHGNIAPESIDLIIVATTTPDQTFPSTACSVQANIGNTHAAAFDIQAVCSGFVYALTIADQFIRTGQSQRALVIGAESFSRLLDWSDRSTCVLFGDGAGAILLEASTTPGILQSKLYADGRHAQALKAEGFKTSSPKVSEPTPLDPFVRMDGRTVYRFAVQAMAQALEETLGMAQMTTADLDWVVPHQANQRILDAVAEKVKLPKEKLISTVGLHANTSAASIPLALSIASKDGRLQPEQTIALVSMGGGFTWGGMILKW
jgi:3-oxoacyl-[acyl-carrier-protein] synthase III